MRALRPLAPLLLLVLSLAGCKQGLGDRCQIDADCSSDLICVLPQTGSISEGGTCQPPGTGALDLGSTNDLSAVSTGDLSTAPDAAVAPDQAVTDATALPDTAATGDGATGD